MGKGNGNSYTTQQFINAIPGSGGIISTIAARVGCTWNTAKKYVTEFATVRAAYDDECETINDKAESTLIRAIEDGDIASAKWWLSKKRKQMFGEALDVTSDGKSIVVRLVGDG